MTEDVRKGLGFGYKTESGKICMIKCFECGKENYALAVSSGCCSKCGHDANAQIKNAQDVIPGASKD